MRTAQAHAEKIDRPDREARFRGLFEAEFTYVWNSLRRLGVPERDLEDVGHDLFVAVHERLDDLDPDRPVRPWLFAFAFRFSSDYRRLARHRREQVQERPEAIDAAPWADEQLSMRETRALVIEALGTLEEGRRAVFVLHELDGCPIPEVATTMGIPLNTAYSRLRLARAGFRKAVRRIQRRRGEG